MLSTEKLEKWWDEYESNVFTLKIDCVCFSVVTGCVFVVCVRSLFRIRCRLYFLFAIFVDCNLLFTDWAPTNSRIEIKIVETKNTLKLFQTKRNQLRLRMARIGNEMNRNENKETFFLCWLTFAAVHHFFSFLFCFCFAKLLHWPLIYPDRSQLEMKMCVWFCCALLCTNDNDNRIVMRGKGKRRTENQTKKSKRNKFCWLSTEKRKKNRTVSRRLQRNTAVIVSATDEESQTRDRNDGPIGVEQTHAQATHTQTHMQYTAYSVYTDTPTLEKMKTEKGECRTREWVKRTYTRKVRDDEFPSAVRWSSMCSADGQKSRIRTLFPDFSVWRFVFAELFAANLPNSLVNEQTYFRLFNVL